MSDAARAARTSFGDIKSGASEMAGATSGSMMEARHGVMLLGEEFGIHLPRGVTAFITSLGPVAAAMEAAFPFLAIAVAAKVLWDALGKNSEEANKTATAWRKVADIGAEAFSVMQDRLTQAEIKADELAGDHLAALEAKLKLIDHQTMREVIGELDKMASAADTAFKGLEHGWFMRLMMGDADVGPAKSQLESMIAEIDKLKQGGGKGSDVQALIGGDIQTVKSDMDAIWNRLETAKKNLSVIGDGKEFAGMRAEAEKAASLAQQEWDFKQKELDVLSQMQKVTAEGVKAGEQEGKNTKTEDAQREQAAQDAAYRAEIEGLNKRATAEREFYKHQHEMGKEAAKQSSEAARQMSAEQEKADEAVHKLGLEHIQATQAETLAEYISGKNKQKDILDSQHQLGLISEREYAEQLITIYRQEAEAQKQFAELQIDRTADPDKKLELQKRMQEEQDKYTASIQKTNTALQQFDSSWTLYFGKMEASTKELGRNMRTELQSSIDQTVNSFSTGFAKMVVEGQSLGRSMQHLAAEMTEHWIEAFMKQLITHEMVSIQHIIANEQTAASDKATAMQSQMSAAKAGAAKAYEAMAGIPIIGPGLGAVAAAGAFALMMGFNEGGIVPGTSNTDSVPAMLTPGESVLPKDLTEGLQRAARSGDGGSSRQPTHVHNHYHEHNWHAIDGASVKNMLDKHADTFDRHVENRLRRMNR